MEEPDKREYVDDVRRERRKWREGTPGRPPGPAIEAPNDKPDPSTIFVEGRADVLIWTPEKRTRYNELCRAAEYFGMITHEVDFQETRGRKTWAAGRKPLEDCFDEIAANPGISFDEWAAICYPPIANGATAARAAKQNAHIALSRLNRDARIEKRYGANGTMYLYVIGSPIDSQKIIYNKPDPKTRYDAALQKIVVAPGILYEDWVKAAFPICGSGEVFVRASRDNAAAALRTLMKQGLVERRLDSRGRVRLFREGAAIPERAKILGLQTAFTPDEKYARRPPEVENPPTDEELFVTTVRKKPQADRKGAKRLAKKVMNPRVGNIRRFENEIESFAIPSGDVDTPRRETPHDEPEEDSDQ